MSPRSAVSVLGGSTPFAATLFDEIDHGIRLSTAGGGGAPEAELTLFGRDSEALALLAAYGNHRLNRIGWRVGATIDLAAALDGAEIVIHQIRYGGLVGRASDEQLAVTLCLPADETLGPSGLQAAIRTARGLTPVAAAITRWCPDATVINLTNPLSCSTALLSAWTPNCTVGLCELPRTTLADACAVLGLDPSEVEWDYVGLNHRGFICRIEFEGRDRIGDLRTLLGMSGTIGGITGQEIAALGSLPLKYFSSFTRPRLGDGSRAGYLADVRRAALRDLRRTTQESPASLAGREQPWYRYAVVPFLLASLPPHAPRRSDHVVNVIGKDGIAREMRAELEGGTLRHRSAVAPPNPRVHQWISAFEAHERLAIDSALDPSRATIRAALAADPLVPSEIVDKATALVSARSVFVP